MRESVRMMEAAGVTAADSVVDIGGGASQLVDELLTMDFDSVTVLDVSAEAIRLAQERLGDEADRAAWLARDLLCWEPERTWRVWHDRAVLHFFTTPPAQRAYLRCLHAATSPGSVAIIATFSPDGPEQCSGLPVTRYSAPQLANLLEPAWRLVADEQQDHITPAGAVQPFTWAVLRREG